MILSMTQWDSWEQKLFCFPYFLTTGNTFYSPSKTFPEFQRGRVKQLLIREGRRLRDKGGRVKRNNNATLGKGPGFPQGIYIIISFSCFADTEVPTWWEKLGVYCPPAGKGNGTPLQYSCLENSMGGGAW